MAVKGKKFKVLALGRQKVCDGHSPVAQVKSEVSYLPVGHVANEMLFEHEAPLFDNVEQGALHHAAINPNPTVEDFNRLHGLHLHVDLLKPCKHIVNIP